MAEKKFMVTIESLEKYFGEEKDRVHVLKGISLDIPEGSLYTFLGPSGCGKTTTLRCVAGLERPDGGKISIDDKAVFASGERVYIPTNKRPIGMVFQSYAIWPHMTVFENVAYPLTIQRRPRSEIRKRVEDVLKVVGLHGLEDRPAPKLSGGQQQRVAFARALVNEPKVMLLDEPLSNLDAKLRVQMRFEIKALQRRVNITTIFVTHDQAEALSLGDRVCVMNEGEILQIGSPHEVYSSPNSLFVAQFVGEMNFIHGRVSAAGEVESPLGKFSCAVPRGCETGREVTLAIRPEHLVLRPETARSSEGVAAKVLIKNYLGDAALLEVEACGVSLRVKLSGDAGFTVGQNVVLVLPQDRWRVFS